MSTVPLVETGGTRTPFIFVRYLIGMASLLVGLVAALWQIIKKLLTVISMSGYAFITRDPLSLVRTKRKARHINWFPPLLEDLTMSLSQLLVDDPRSQVTHFV